MKKSFMKIGALSAAVAVMLTSGVLGFTDKAVKASEVEMKDSKQIVKEMGIGWDLGNSLDATASWLPIDADPSEFETAWGNPVTTKEMIDKIKEGGFKTVRIPITWGQHMAAAPDYTIDSKWMDRVQEVVDYCIDDGLYAIINVHHDSDWCVPTYEKEPEVTPKLQSLWTQVATRFKGYNDHLVFETLNEPRLIGTPYEWNGGTEESRDVVNKYNKVALDAIRATGGNNDERSVMIPPYAAASWGAPMSDLAIPDDDHIIVSLHAYSPYTFAMDASGTDKWGTDADRASLDAELDSFYNAFVAKGIPVVIGEFGSINKDNIDSRKALAAHFVSGARKRGMACIWWDNNVSAPAKQGETFGIFNRTTYTWEFPELHNALINSYNNTKSLYE